MGSAAMFKPRIEIPACFPDAKSYHVWLAHARQSHLTLSENAHCVDCTVAYQREMIRQRRCNNPTATFKEDDNA